MLFHYFGSKEQLYETLIQFVFDTLYREIGCKINWKNPIIFDRLMQLTMVKIEVGKQYPQLFNFIKNILLFSGTVNTEDIFALYKKHGFDFQHIYQDIYERTLIIPNSAIRLRSPIRSI